MNLRYRLAFYLFGLMVGIIFVYFFMTKKAEASGVTFCYMPNCRVLQDLRSKPLEIDTVAAKKLEEKWVTLEDIRKSLEYGDVDFSKSNKPFEKGKLYVIEGRNTSNEEIIISMINYENRAVLKDIIKE
jgi:hypothetical protein